MLNTQELMQVADQLFSSAERNNNVILWNELSEFLLNNQSGLFLGSASAASDSNISSMPGSKRTGRVFSSVGMQAAQDLAAAFQGTLTNPATVWSNIRLTEDDLNNNGEVVSWIEDCNKKMHRKFSDSNLYNELGKAYQSFVVLANLAILQETGDDNEFVFTSVHLSQLAWAENKNGLVDTVFRKITLSAKQCMERWGDKNHPSVIKCFEKEPNKEFDILHAIFPRDKKSVKKGLTEGKHRPIASIYIDITHNLELEDNGYYEMPIYSARWGLMPGERYGRGPGHLALPDVRTLNTLTQRGLEARALQVRPPMFANNRDIIGPLDLRPGAMNVVVNHTGFKEFVTQANTPAEHQEKQDLKDSIRSIFFLDKLLLPPRTETGEMTAFEVSQRVEQMQRVLGPVLSRLDHELLSPLIIRSFKAMLRDGEFLPTPQVLLLRGIDIDISFVNQLARAQQIQDVNVIQQWAQAVMGIAQARPEILDNLNVDGIAKHIAKVLGVPEIAIENDDTMEATRQARQQQQQAAAGLAAAEQGSVVAKNLGVSAEEGQ